MPDARSCTADDVQVTEDTELTGKYTPDHSHRGRCCVRYGNTRVLCSLSSSYGYFPSTCHVGPHWGCMLVTYCLAVGPAFFFFARNDILLGLQITLVVSICLTTASFTMVACSDPGVVFQDLDLTNLPMQGDIETGVICAQCELDHHCPWTGKCIGERTNKWFYVFLTSISLHCMLIGAVCLITFVPG
ncbi:hypothetical protein JM18_008656 [Phytophthora kernoviae]|uniref:Palmitoyltransferase n=1 Tax=Phytophthora kernoviae TaxID=325452 RepID=A0A921SAW0_9STRA|nr:hypothetical protein JM18_008656 [Phytophthora kernoviae]